MHFLYEHKYNATSVITQNAYEYLSNFYFESTETLTFINPLLSGARMNKQHLVCNRALPIPMPA